VPDAVHLNLDDAWPAGVLGLPARDLRGWGPRLRYAAPSTAVGAFVRECGVGRPGFVLYGSGDFHYLAGLFLHSIAVPVHVVSFDNHPDWDVRPPRWACGSWVNRALELDLVRGVAVWGCGNFELNWPSRLFANHAAMRSGRLRVFPWAERFPAHVARRFGAVTREGWRDRFDAFARGLAGAQVYATVDLDCLADGAAVTNWEQGLFTPEDVAWALRRLRESATVIAGDVCGAYSPPRYARRGQRFIGEWDHPRLPPPEVDAARRVNVAALETIWPALTS
jgi:hypothetical protein